ncbi:hypothetical protein GW950_00100 [Candidatus Wolfebacteria bacterium]|nr:hypothetical protein [Candidatus Wolfebacteria bacterium]
MEKFKRVNKERVKSKKEEEADKKYFKAKEIEKELLKERFKNNPEILEQVLPNPKPLFIKESKQESDKESKYNRKEIEAIKEDFLLLVRNLKEAIRNEEYDVLISDDTSARLVTLAIREILKEEIEKKYTDLSSESRRDKLKTFFIAGGGGKDGVNLKEVADYFSKKRGVIKKALLITEYIASGKSLERLAYALEAAKIDFDIAALAIEKDESFYVDNLPETYSGRKFYIGSQHRAEPEIYAAKNLSGVTKSYGHSSAHPYLYSGRSSSEIKEAREDIKILAKEGSNIIF